MAVLAAYSVSPRWRGRVTVLLPRGIHRRWRDGVGATGRGGSPKQQPGVGREVRELPLVQKRHGRPTSGTIR